MISFVTADIMCKELMMWLMKPPLAPGFARVEFRWRIKDLERKISSLSEWLLQPVAKRVRSTWVQCECAELPSPPQGFMREHTYKGMRARITMTDGRATFDVVQCKDAEVKK